MRLSHAACILADEDQRELRALWSLSAPASVRDPRCSWPRPCGRHGYAPELALAACAARDAAGDLQLEASKPQLALLDCGGGGGGGEDDGGG
eukprot:6193045-Pleurochrysis_carterae.AAC.1